MEKSPFFFFLWCVYLNFLYYKSPTHLLLLSRVFCSFLKNCDVLFLFFVSPSTFSCFFKHRTFFRYWTVYLKFNKKDTPSSSLFWNVLTVIIYIFLLSGTHVFTFNKYECQKTTLLSMTTNVTLSCRSPQNK